MKRLIIFLICISVSLFAFACEEQRIDNVSFRHTAYLIGSCEDIKVTVKSGERESPYIADGKKGELVDFCVINLAPKVESALNKNYTYEINVDGEKYVGSLNKDLFGTGYSKDVGVDIGEKVTSIIISDGEKNYPIELENMMANALISEEEALKITEKEFKDKLIELEEQGKTREIYVKFVSDSTGEESYYYWYVANVLENGDYMALLLDIVSGDVIAKRGS